MILLCPLFVNLVVAAIVPSNVQVLDILLKNLNPVCAVACTALKRIFSPPICFLAIHI